MHPLTLKTKITTARLADTREFYVTCLGMSLLYKKTGNLRACQLLLGHSKLESTVRYLGVEVDDALELSEALEL